MNANEQCRGKMSQCWGKMSQCWSKMSQYWGKMSQCRGKMPTCPSKVSTLECRFLKHHVRIYVLIIESTMNAARIAICKVVDCGPRGTGFESRYSLLAYMLFLCCPYGTHIYCDPRCSNTRDNKNRVTILNN